MVDRDFFWSRRWIVVYLAFTAVTGALVVFTTLNFLSFLNGGGHLNRTVGLFAMQGLVLTLYISPRIIGILRNRMRIRVFEDHLETPFGRKIPRQLISQAMATAGDDPPYLVIGGLWPHAKILIYAYEDRAGLSGQLRGLSTGVKSDEPDVSKP